MTDLKTLYLGIPIKNPLVVGASNLVTDLSNLIKLEEAGAAAVVYKSLFEEQIQLEAYAMEEEAGLYEDWDAEHASIFPKLGHAGPEEHLLKLKRVKEALTIPVIGSLNCVYEETWEEYAIKMAETGVDALELNFYANVIDPVKTGTSIVGDQINLLKRVKEAVKIPVSIKLSPYYTNTLGVVTKMDQAGADGFVLFNRLFQPDIDLDQEEHHFPYNFSSSTDNRLALRYAGLLFDNVKGTICSNTGIMTGADVIKMIMAGADTVQVVSAIYKKGISHIGTMLEDIREWMERKGYKRLTDFKGKLARSNMNDPFAYKRAQYIDILMKSELLMQYHPKEGDDFLQH
ncbi:MAG: dihydroorotate dehydrogenase-like protein [Cyclobacteriaceae bacterium]|nr:dihydroorotate dehydrogenase-like protein [Cyclobacteriaceae bacterium HetDA_MAG_MS6]